MELHTSWSDRIVEFYRYASCYVHPCGCIPFLHLRSIQVYCSFQPDKTNKISLSRQLNQPGSSRWKLNSETEYSMGDHSKNKQKKKHGRLAVVAHFPWLYISYPFPALPSPCVTWLEDETCLTRREYILLLGSQCMQKMGKHTCS